MTTTETWTLDDTLFEAGRRILVGVVDGHADRLPMCELSDPGRRAMSDLVATSASR